MTSPLWQNDFISNNTNSQSLKTSWKTEVIWIYAIWKPNSFVKFNLKTVSQVETHHRNFLTKSTLFVFLSRTVTTVTIFRHLNFMWDRHAKIHLVGHCDVWNQWTHNTAIPTDRAATVKVWGVPRNLSRRSMRSELFLILTLFQPTDACTDCAKETGGKTAGTSVGINTDNNSLAATVSSCHTQEKRKDESQFQGTVPSARQ